MKIYRIAQENRLYEGDRVKASFKNAFYDGIVDYVLFEDNEFEYSIKFDKWEKFSDWAQKNTSRDIYAILDWMEGSFKLKDLILLQKGKRWETVKSDLELVKTETFIYYGREWDVRAAKRIIHDHPRPIQQFDVKGVGYYVRSGAIAIDSNAYKQSNLNIPVILISTNGDENGQFPIDGWHRIKKALEDGIETIPAYVLTEEESRSIEIQP